MKTQPIDDVFAKHLTNDQIAEADRKAMRTVYALRAIRRARNLTQEQLAQTLDVAQAEVSRVERRTDLHVSTLRRYIEAMGGELVITARFPDGEAEIVDFAEQGLAADLVPV